MKKKLRSVPPPTAHRLAAWLSLAKPLANVKPNEVRFMPTLEDINSFMAFWHQRLIDLRNAGTNALVGRRPFDAAMACKPHAFWYAGTGKCCRRWFCPYCNAAEAAAVYERLRRVAQQHGPSFGFVLNRDTTRELLTDLPSMTRSFLNADAEHFACNSNDEPECFGAMIRCSIWPHEDKRNIAVLQPWAIYAVTADYSKSVYDVWKKRRREGVRSLDDRERHILYSEDSSIRRAPFSLAKAAARICQYPKELLTAPPTRVASLLNAIDGIRLSTIRGVFRSPLPPNPKNYPMQFVPTNRNGNGVVEWLLAHSTNAGECTAAREFAHQLGLPPSDTFAALSPALGFPIYWLGQFDVNWGDFARSKRIKDSELLTAIKKNRPRKPPERHAMVFLWRGQGLIVCSTWPPYRETSFMINAFPKGIVMMHAHGFMGKNYLMTDLSTYRIFVLNYTNHSGAGELLNPE